MVWLEFRCENRTNPDRPQVLFGPRCWSDTNSGPMDGTYADTITALADTYRGMCVNAENIGWRKLKDGWTCPDCVKSLESRP